MELKSGILLTGGSGSRLAHFTNRVANKHLYPIEDKLVLDYSINTVKKLNITNLTVVLGGDHFSQIAKVLKDGEEYGLKINYVYQNKPNGIAACVNLCEPFIKDNNFAVILGDNLFQKKIKYNKNFDGAQIFITDNENIILNNFGCVSLNEGDNIVSFIEKPKELNTKLSHYAITGCYIFNQKFFKYFKNIKLSDRGEFEVVDIIKQYHENDELDWSFLNGWWMDGGNLASINKAKELMKTDPVEF